MSYPPVKFRALMRLVALAPLLGGGIAVPSFAATDPLVLSNDAGGRPVSSLRATSLYWDVKQMDDVGMDAPRMCRVAKTMPDGSILAPRVGVMSVPSIDVTSSKLALPKTATVPVTLSFDRALPPVQATGQIDGTDRLVIAVPSDKLLYDYLGQASVLRVSVANGAAMRGVTFDLSGLKTALADAQTCLQAVPTAPMPKSIKAAPPPLPTRTPDAIAENLDGDMPDVTTGASIPPLDWPDLEGDAVATKTQSEDKMNTEPSGAVFSDVPVDMPVKDQWDVQIGQAPAVPVSVSAAPVVAPMPAPVFAPAPIQQDVSLKPRAHKIVVSGPPVDQPAPMQFGATGQISAPVPETQPLDTYRARKGESLRDVLRRWSDRAHVDLVWTMASDIILQHDFSHVGDFQPAVAGLLAQYPQSGIKTTLAEQGTAPLEHQPFVEEARAPMVAPQPVTAPDLQDFTPNPPPVVDRARGPLMPYASVLDGAVASSPGPSVVVPPPVSSLPMKAGASVAPRVEPTAPIVPTVPTVAAPPSSPPPSVGPVRRWRALTGASVRQVVQAWAEDAGLPVLWMGNDDFAVRASVNKTSDFGGAVATLFGQYGRDPVRPMGQIYRDPQTGQSTLVVRIVK